MYYEGMKKKKCLTRPLHEVYKLRLSKRDRARLDAAAAREDCPVAHVMRALVRSLPEAP